MDTAHRLAIIESTVPVLEQYGRAIMDRFYERLLDENPSLTQVFNLTHQATGAQPQALADAVTAAARNVRNLSVLVPAVTQIAHKHRSLGVTPEQYAIVGQTLLAAMKDVLGEAATPDIIDAWGQTYQGLAEIFIQSEQQLYDEAHNTRGGWSGFRAFTVIDKVRESDEITSFYLSPKDAGELPSFLSGQYVSVRVPVTQPPGLVIRQYSLSDAPSKPHWRISVKREDEQNGHPQGCPPLTCITMSRWGMFWN